MTPLAMLIDQAEGAVVAPGVYDPFTANLATQAGFDCLYLSGASLAYTQLGRPDLGLVTMTEVADSIAAIRDRVDAALIVDADTGYGNALNVQRTMRMFERSGASAIQLEDQTFPKRCGHLSGKSLISADEMVGKIQAAADARYSEATQIIARTDGIAVEGITAALERAERYLEAGADVLFIEAPQSLEQQRMITEHFGQRVPLLANMVEGGRTPAASADELAEIGFKLVIFPGGLARAVSRQVIAYFESLKAHGTTEPFRDRMAGFDELNRAVGLPEMLETAERYAVN
ncbi:isocitrate lyase-family enzyme [Halomonas cupida]|uniref:2-Methylisocitrate lyase, PEP mutase family n=1 Tax=Halomonas cupida TaxID=44933 RepID=A0A1M7CQF2_9GAMM|nr:isocitrate lyase/phosphoenolpyruvate mutase family protein [Halomonas cupida]GEN26062.1 isocitrate lyase-family enzyme [Halomonas cupida]SHL69486.1 2-Methylisocitrate lyase, PEP mutase family [Halomonas cupida]